MHEWRFTYETNTCVAKELFMCTEKKIEKTKSVM